MGQEGCKGPSPSSAVTAWDLGVTPHSHCATSEGLTWNSRSKRKKGASLPSSWDATGGVSSIPEVRLPHGCPASSPVPRTAGKAHQAAPTPALQKQPSLSSQLRPTSTLLPTRNLGGVQGGQAHTPSFFWAYMTQAEKYNSAFWRK